MCLQTYINYIKNDEMTYEDVQNKINWLYIVNFPYITSLSYDMTTPKSSII